MMVLTDCRKRLETPFMTAADTATQAAKYNSLHSSSIGNYTSHGGDYCSHTLSRVGQAWLESRSNVFMHLP